VGCVGQATGVPAPGLQRALLVVGAGLGARRVLRSPQSRFARAAGSSVAAPDAAGWVTDFLNAAYFARPAPARDVEDLRLAFGIVTTRWHALGHRRLRAYDVLPFHKTFMRARLTASPRGDLDRDALLEGAAKLVGPWFPDAWADPARRGWGIAFPTADQRDAYDPEVRLRGAGLSAPTPPVADPRHQIWHTYPPVPVPSAPAVIAAITRPETWPDYASALGRFTPVRRGGLLDQTFEIEVVARLAPRLPAYTRGYVTITRLVTPDDPSALHAYFDELNENMVRLGRDEPPPVPDGATPLVGFDLTTHEGHFMGRARNRLVLYEQDGQAFLRAAGTWDEMPWALDQAYRRAGQHAQQAFWGMGTAEESMLHQIARAVR